MEYPKILISGSYNAFLEGWNGAGIYDCSGNYVSQTFKIPAYFGSAQDLQKRIEYEHITPLNLNHHPHNPPLQNAWNKYGQENFVWWLLESCPPEKAILLEREQYYLDLYRPFVDEFGGFNIAHDTKNGMKGRKHTKKTKQKLSESHKGKSRSPSTEFKKGIESWNKGKAYVN